MRSQDVQWLNSVLKGIRCNNFYYLKDSVVAEKLAVSKNLEGDTTRL